MSTPVPDSIERLRYWQGQKLLSRDFRDQLVTDAQMRWWHNRALHNAYGVRLGLNARLEGGQVVVESGVAYDCFGRELILQRERRIALPSGQTAGQQMVLMIRYQETSAYLSSRDSSGVCLPCENQNSLEEPEFFWAPAAKVSFREGVPVGRLAGVELDEDFRPPVSRPLARPRIGSGVTVPGDTAWELWSETAFGGATVPVPRRVDIGIQVTIDTSAAGFTSDADAAGKTIPPCYFAWLQGQLWGPGFGSSLFFPVLLDHIANASFKQFTFRLWMPAVNAVIGARLRSSNTGFGAEFLNYARRQKLYVCWLGIQHAAGF